MRLKSIEMIGFKSFPDRTVLNFEHGVTVIVGPNGSGKSNISDAIRWVLGEISSKNMRSTKMEDVIFGGSASRKAMGYTQVSLIIDNSVEEEDRLPVDFEEVEVTRRYYRTGESEYMINRKPVRLRDIYELFMNTGIGKTGYSLIGQGKAAEIISQKSSERRTIFEEAAGISKYRFKKSESERKLEATQINLDRVSDLLGELEGRVGPLEKESEKAKRYLEIFETKKRADVSLWLYDVKNTHDALEKTEADLAVAAKELEIATEELQSLENNNDRSFEALQQNKMKLAEEESEERSLEESRHSLESSVLLAEQELGHLSSQRETAFALLAEKKDHREELNEKIAASQEKLGKETENEQALQTEYEEKNEELDTKQISLYDGEQAVKKIEEEIGSLEDEKVTRRLSLSSLRGSATGQDERKAALLAEKEERNKNVDLLSGRIAQADESIAAYQKKISETTSLLQEIDSKNASFENRRRSLSSERDRLYLNLEAGKNKVSSLRRMEELFEGYSQSVRFVMQESGKGVLSGICGPVSHLITVDRQYGIAVETALGSNMQNVICEDEAAAKGAIRHLKNSSAGRATFYPIKAMRPNLLTPDAATKNAPGYVGVAHELVGYDAKYAPVIEYLLGRTLVFDNIDHASEVAKAGGYKVRIVTLDGQLINAGGSYTGGSVKRDSGILSRREEITSLEKELEKVKKEFDEKEKQLEALKKESEEAEGEKTRKSEYLALTQSLMQAEDTQKKILDTQVSSDREALEKIDAELESLSKAASFEEAERARIEGMIAETDRKIEEKQSALSSLLSENEKKKEEIDSLREQINLLRISLAEKRKDIYSLQNEITSFSSRLVSLSEQITLDENTIAGLGNKEENNRSKAERDRSILMQITEKITSSRERNEALRKVIEEGETKLNSLREAIKVSSNRKELAFRQHVQLQSRFESLKSESDKISVRIWEEYELTYSAAAELDYPKVTAETRAETVKVLTDAKNKLRAIGHVNVGAIEEYKEVKEKYDFLKSQSDDLKQSRESLIDVIAKLEREMRVKFVESFEQINLHFGEVFRELFGGGKAEIKLEDPDNVLESGIEINVAPPGKIIKNLVQLSGGEQTFVSIALFFAILRVNPTPFCLFDEIESALDEVNVERFANYIKNYTGKTQFILISHRRGSIEQADTIYGVTMYEKGISKVLTLDVNEVEQKTGVKI